MNNSNIAFGKFLFLWSGQFISAVGSGISAFGLGVYIYGQTGKASTMALVTLLAFLPSLLLSPIAGVLADRYDRRLLMILGDSLSIVGLLFILVCLLRGEAQLWQICVGVTISSVFASLLEPAYKATVTDLLTEDQYTRASGLVQVAGSSKYLISPVVAGFLLTVSDIQLLLGIDISTFFVTVIVTLIARRGMETKISPRSESFRSEIKVGWQAIAKNQGVFALVFMAAALTFFLGFFQTLSLPMILAFANSAVAGTLETISALGMLVSSVLLGMLAIKKGFVKMLSVSLFWAGLFMAAFGLRENVVLIGITGVLFFAALPFAHTSLDFLIRTNIENTVQGRAWALIGLISQLGYVAAYALSGLLADYVFTPLLLDSGALADSVGKIIGTGSGRGTGLLIILAGLLLCVTAIVIDNINAIQQLEKRGVSCISESFVTM